MTASCLAGNGVTPTAVQEAMGWEWGVEMEPYCSQVLLSLGFLLKTLEKMPLTSWHRELSILAGDGCILHTSQQSRAHGSTVFPSASRNGSWLFPMVRLNARLPEPLPFAPIQSINSPFPSAFVAICLPSISEMHLLVSHSGHPLLTSVPCITKCVTSQSFLPG